MKVTETALPGTKLIEPAVFGDQRGYFLETWNQARYADAGIDYTFVQSNVSRSRQGVLRGLHFQNPDPQGKLVYVLEGAVFDVAVDIREGSPTFGEWTGHELTATNARQLFIPPGFAHGFCVLSDSALFCYHCTSVYRADADDAVAWNDPTIGIPWPVEQPQISSKDQSAIPLHEHQNLPSYE